MNKPEFDKIVERAYQKLEPSLDRQIERYRESTNVEIINGLRVLKEKRERIQNIIAEALSEYRDSIEKAIINIL
jgi:23S rRNA maturation mini-RNase III